MASGSQSVYKGSDEIPNADCDLCLSSGETLEAVSYCSICCEYLCQSCERAHRVSRASRDHTLLKGGNFPSASTRTKPTLPFMFCDTHRTALLDIYCTTHDGVICSACKLTAHTTCDTGDVTRHSARNVEEELKKVIKSLRDLTFRYEDLRTNRVIAKSAVKTQITKCFSDMHQLRKDINDKLDQLENKMSSEIRNIDEKMNNEIDRHVTLADDILRQIGDLDKSLSECQKTRKNDVMFVGMKKASSQASECGHILDNVQKDIYPVDIRFQPNDVLTDMIQQLQSLGTVDNNQPANSGQNRTSILNMSVNNQPANTEQTQTSILNMSVQDKQEIHVKVYIVWGCTFMSDGHLLLACGKDGLKLFDKDFKLKSQSAVPALDVSAINDTDVIVTQRHQQLQRVRVLPDMAVKETLKMDRQCYVVDVYGDEIYVTCHDNPGNGEVPVLNMSGTVTRRFGKVKRKYLFTRPDGVKVNLDGTKVFVSDWDTNIVTCLNNQGHVIYQYSDRGLKAPVGMYVDGEDNLLVCGSNSHNVHVVHRGDDKEYVVLSEKGGMKKPCCISYRQSDGCLVVGLLDRNDNGNNLIIFNTR